MKKAQLLFPVLYAFVTNTPDTDPATIAATAADHATRASAIADTNATVASANASIASISATIATAAVAAISTTAAATTSTRAADIATTFADTANTAAATSTIAANNSTIAAAIALAAAANAISAADTAISASDTATTASATSTTVANNSTMAAAIGLAAAANALSAVNTVSTASDTANTASATSTTVVTTSTIAAATSASSSATDATDAESDEYSGDFKCCICLDLICKPVVLACGHLSCFWCVFKSMHTEKESRCPLCRHSYYHLPSICWLLHFLLLKVYTDVYQKRESQIMEEEKTSGTFSSEPITFTCDNNCNTNDEIITENLSVEGCNKRVSVTDVLCRICDEILYQPVVLNCGHVFCEVCIVGITNEQKCRCPVCQSVHPNGLPKVCCDLDRFLEQHLSEEYNAKKVAINQHIEMSEQETASTESIQVPNGGESSTVSMSEHVSSTGRKVHFGVGCDHCGMYPLIGDRYKCTDCLEEIGFDLCEECHNTSPNLPGKFNQQHKPEHNFAVIELTDTQTNVESDVVGPTQTNDISPDHEHENTGLISQADPYQQFFPILVIVWQLVQFFFADHV